MKRAAILLLALCAVAIGRNVTITNPTTQPIPIKQVASSAPVATPTASPIGTATATPTATASAGTGLADGDPVSSWVDSSGAGHNATQTGTARPTFKTNIVGGKPVVRFTAANSQFLTLASPISGANPFSCFVVMKATAYSATMISLSSITGQPYGPYCLASNGVYISNRTNYSGDTSDHSAVFHVFTGEIVGSSGNIWLDGTLLTLAGGSNPASGDFDTIGHGGTAYSNGDIAEIIMYDSVLAVRAKLFLVLGVLITTGQIPSPEEADALLAAGDLVALEAYLIEHGVPVEQARDTLEPMAVGDRANIEKYLGTKYGITVAGGTAVDPSTVAGLMGWWKADSLAGAAPFDPTTIAGLKGWWKADAITVGGLLKDALEKGDSIQPFSGLNPLAAPPDGTRIGTWPDSSSSGNNQTGGATYKANIINGKPVLRFDGSNDSLYSLSSMGIAQPFTVFLVGKPPDSPPSTRCAFLWSLPLTLAVTLEQGSGHYFLYEQPTALEDTIDSSAAFHVYSVVFASAVATGYRDGAMRMSGPTGTGGIGNLAIFWDGSAGRFPGDMAEILVYDTALSTTDRQNVENYLKAKYGLP